jgi:hypothetical protein
VHADNVVAVTAWVVVRIVGFTRLDYATPVKSAQAPSLPFHFYIAGKMTLILLLRIDGKVLLPSQKSQCYV